jgi:hypothetical protein
MPDPLQQTSAVRADGSRLGGLHLLPRKQGNARTAQGASTCAAQKRLGTSVALANSYCRRKMSASSLSNRRSCRGPPNPVVDDPLDLVEHSPRTSTSQCGRTASGLSDA